MRVVGSSVLHPVIPACGLSVGRCDRLWFSTTSGFTRTSSPAHGENTPSPGENEGVICGQVQKDLGNEWGITQTLKYHVKFCNISLGSFDRGIFSSESTELYWHERGKERFRRSLARFLARSFIAVSLQESRKKIRIYPKEIFL
jgi:hypothetical protein